MLSLHEACQVWLVSVMVFIYIFRHCRERRTKTKKPAGISNEGQINVISLRSFLEREQHQCIQCGAAAQFRLCRSDGGAGFGGTEAEILESGHGVGCMATHRHCG